MLPKLNLSQRIASGYLFMVAITCCFGIFSLISLTENRKGYKELTEILIPSTEQLKKLQTLVKESNLAIRKETGQNNEAELTALKKIHDDTYPAIRTRLKIIYAQINDSSSNQYLRILLSACDDLIHLQKQELEARLLINEHLALNKANSNTDLMKNMARLSILEDQVNHELDFILIHQTDFVNKKENAQKAQGDYLARVLNLILLFILFVGIASTIITTRLIRQPIVHLKKTILAMSKGEIPEIKRSNRKDEVGLINNAFLELTESLKKKAAFAIETGKGNYNVNFQLLSRNDELGNALVEMNKILFIKAEEDQKENWLKGGIAQMSDLLRNEHSNTGALYSNIISFLSRYIVMNQGALYLIKEDKDKNNYFEMVAGFACDRNKALNKRVAVSEGYVGQAASEKKTLLLKNLPDDYLKINSGLGEATPTNIVVVPLLFENEIQGVVELSSFSEIVPLQVELLERLSSIIAATFDLINRKIRTELLLFESQDLNDMLIERENALKKSNEDLTEKGKQLKVSEEELREQQEVLLQTNTQLEEKAQLLSIQNEEISLKNEQLELAKEAIRLKAEELENTSRYKSEFLANMSHELRTPLNSILILSNLLSENKDKNLNEKQIEYARVVKRSGTDLLTLINDILDLSKIESRKIELEITDIKIKDLGGEIESLFREVAKDKKVNFFVNYGSGLPETISSDKMRIEQVIKNLLSNSFKFTEKNGTVELNIDLTPANQVFNNSMLNPAEPIISLSVKDSGIGIPPDKQHLIFEAFKQVDGSTSRKYGGTGLGLSISKELAVILGGEIQLKSIPGLGSTFTLFIPIQSKLDNVPDEDKTEETKNKIQSFEKVLSSKPDVLDQISKTDLSGADRLVLIIEDDEDFAKILLNHATKKGFTGMHAKRGDTGLINARRFKPDAIILDLNVPGMDGWSVMRRIKEDPDLQDIPVHIISGHEESQKKFPSGAVEILRKPVNNKQLNKIFETLNTSLSRRVKKVLIIEDNACQNDSIKALLENPDLDCYSALSGKEAIEKLNLEHFDLITLDLALPDISGFELLKCIKETDKFQHIPVIIYTGKNLTIEESRELNKYSERIILKTERSFEKLAEETNQFLNKLADGSEGIEKGKENKDDQRQTPIQKNPKTASESLKGKKVLLVDDDIRNVFAMTSILEQEEFSLLIANDGNEALSMLANNPDTDIILMDIMMPGMDGFEAMKQIRAQDHFSKLPILALTAKAMKGDKERCIEAGASEYLSKPVDPVVLMSTIKTLLFQYSEIK